MGRQTSEKLTVRVLIGRQMIGKVTKTQFVRKQLSGVSASVARWTACTTMGHQTVRCHFVDTGLRCARVSEISASRSSDVKGAEEAAQCVLWCCAQRSVLSGGEGSVGWVEDEPEEEHQNEECKGNDGYGDGGGHS